MFGIGIGLGSKIFSDMIWFSSEVVIAPLLCVYWFRSFLYICDYVSI